MNSNVLLAYHDSNKTVTYQIGDFLIANGIEIYLISDQVPEKISERAKLVQNNGILLVIADRNFQKSIRCMEILHFARDLRKEIFGINLFPDSFTPFGSLGAIINGTKGGFINLIDPTNFELLKPILNIVAAKSLDEKNSKLKQQLPDFRSPTPTNPLLFTTGSKIDVLISVHSDSLEIANIVEEGIRSSSSKITCEIEEVSSSLSSSRVCDCKVLIVIMSPGYEDSIKACLIVEKARSSAIHVVPVSKTREWKPQKWLGMIIAGVFFIRIVNKEKAYEKKYDTYPMKNLVFEVEKALYPKKTSNEIEKALIDSLEKQIEECKVILGNNWPPEIKKRPLIVRKPVKVELETPKAKIEFNHIHYEVTRMELKPPPVLFDEQGRPLRKKFDCMISYQWGIQDFVRDIYMDFHMRSLITWFDIWGFMEENSYNAMATAIECSRVIVVFLTEKYQKSDNCALEFKYAVFCGKPFVFILNDPDLKLEPWIEPHVKENPCFVVPTYKDITQLENNVPKIDIISQAIRAIGQAQPDFDVFDLSEDVIKLKELLSSAKDAIDAQKGSSRFKKCNRCQKTYEESNSIGCKVHSAYYVGGKIIEGRWVCCNQQSKDSVGCRDAPHTDAKRIWKHDPKYGTYTWEPH